MASRFDGGSASAACTVFFPDPRFPGERREVGVLGFRRADPNAQDVFHSRVASVLAGNTEGWGVPHTNRGGASARELTWEELCGTGFLGNAWSHGQDGLLVAPLRGFTAGRPAKPFGNAEAAYQALALWDRAEEFRSLSAAQAQQLSRELAGHQDSTFAGHGGSWQAMLAVLRAKFQPASACAEALRQTGDAFLLEHDGDSAGLSDGTNWLGLQLMLVRDELDVVAAGSKGIGVVAAAADAAMASWTWTAFAQDTCMINLATGGQHPSGGDAWKGAVRSATGALVLKLATEPPARRELHRTGAA